MGVVLAILGFFIGLFLVHLVYWYVIVPLHTKSAQRQSNAIWDVKYCPRRNRFIRTKK